MRARVRAIAFAVGLSSAILLTVRIALPLVSEHEVVFLPFGVLAMDFVLAFVGLVAARAIVRLRGEEVDRNKRANGVAANPVLLIGAGAAGVVVARELASRPDLGLKAVGFLDDDRMKVGTSIHGLTVLGLTSQVKAIAERENCRRALITIANAHGQQIRRITELCRDAGLETKIIPGIYESSRRSSSRIAGPRSRTLLGSRARAARRPVVHYRSRVVMVQGAGRSTARAVPPGLRSGPRGSCSWRLRERRVRDPPRSYDVRFRGAIEPRIADVPTRAHATVFEGAADARVPTRRAQARPMMD